MAEQTYVTLNDGNRIPQYGIGMYMVPEGYETENTVKEALKTGVRHIDTAHAYQNERGVGKAVKESGIDRNDIWITTKLWPSEYGEGKSLTAIDKMLGRLDTDHIDLLLLHQQFGDYLGAWKDMEAAVRMGKVRSIGLANFTSERLEELCGKATIKPAVDQVELHPYYQQAALKQQAARYGMVLESWYPLGHGDRRLLEEPLFSKLAAKYGKSNVQIILRWHIQEGNIIFPKSTDPRHIRENFDIFGFSLAEDEMREIRLLEKGTRFFTMTLKQQEQYLGAWKPLD